MHALLRASTAVLAALLVALPGAGQTVAGRVVEAEGGAPVPGAVVVLEDAAGARLRATVTDGEGSFALRAPAPGRYRVRAERVGFATAAPVAVEVPAEGSPGVVLRADSRRVALPAVAVEGRRRRCDGALSGGAATAVLWEEARKALHSAAVSEEEVRYRFRTEVERTRTTLGGRAVSKPRVWRHETPGAPFATATGEALVRGGYLQMLRDSVVFFGVGAAAILSDAFLRTHCFGVREGGEALPGLVGLEFVPMRGRIAPDVRGVLWLDRASAELRHVEYVYTRLPFSGPTGGVWGHLAFRRLPTGGWVLWRWTIRAPLLTQSSERHARDALQGYRITGYEVTSGRVLEVLEGGARVDVGP